MAQRIQGDLHPLAILFRQVQSSFGILGPLPRVQLRVFCADFLPRIELRIVCVIFASLACSCNAMS